MTTSTTVHPMPHSDSRPITSGSNTLRTPRSLLPKRHLKGKGQWENVQPLPLAGGFRLSLKIIFLFYSHPRLSSPLLAPLLGSVAYLQCGGGGGEWSGFLLLSLRSSQSPQFQAMAATTVNLQVKLAKRDQPASKWMTWGPNITLCGHCVIVALLHREAWVDKHFFTGHIKNYL